MAIISILTFLFGIISFVNKKRYYTLISLFLLAFNFFSFAPSFFYIGSISLQNFDFGLLLVFLILPFRDKSNVKELKYLKRSLNGFILFLIFAILYDFLISGTSASQIFRTVRKTGFFFFFFCLNLFSFKDYKKLLDALLIL